MPDAIKPQNEDCRTACMANGALSGMYENETGKLRHVRAMTRGRKFRLEIDRCGAWCLCMDGMGGSAGCE